MHLRMILITTAIPLLPLVSSNERGALRAVRCVMLTRDPSERREAGNRSYEIFVPPKPDGRYLTDDREGCVYFNFHSFSKVATVFCLPQQVGPECVYGREPNLRRKKTSRICWYNFKPDFNPYSNHMLLGWVG